MQIKIKSNYPLLHLSLWYSREVSVHSITKPHLIQVRVDNCWCLGLPTKHSTGFHRFDQPEHK